MTVPVQTIEGAPADTHADKVYKTSIEMKAQIPVMEYRFNKGALICYFVGHLEKGKTKCKRIENRI